MTRTTVALALALTVPCTALCQTPSVVPTVQGAQAETEATAEARRHFDRGLDLYRQQDFNGALAEFQRAYQLSQRVSVLFNLGVTYQALHRYPAAATAIEEYLARADAIAPERRAEVQQALDQIRGFIAHVRVQVTPGNATVTVDGEAVPPALLGVVGVPVGPGQHTVEATSPGRDSQRRTFTIASGDNQFIQLNLPVTPPRPLGVAMASVTVRGVPLEGELTLDGRTALSTERHVVPAGVHRVMVTAHGVEPWQGDIEVAAGVSRVVTVHMAALPRLSRGFFWGGVALTGAMAATAVVFGAMTASTEAEFHGLYQGDPRVQDVSSRGSTFRGVTNAALAVGVLAGIGTGVLFVLTRTTGPSTAEIAANATTDGAMAQFRLRF